MRARTCPFHLILRELFFRVAEQEAVEVCREVIYGPGRRKPPLFPGLWLSKVVRKWLFTWNYSAHVPRLWPGLNHQSMKAMVTQPWAKILSCKISHGTNNFRVIRYSWDRLAYISFLPRSGCSGRLCEAERGSGEPADRGSPFPFLCQPWVPQVVWVILWLSGMTEISTLIVVIVVNSHV